MDIAPSLSFSHIFCFLIFFFFRLFTFLVVGLSKSFLIINLLPAITSLLLFITFFFMPESPRYLSLQGDTTKAKEILANFKMDDRDLQNDLQLWASAHHKAGCLSAFKEELRITFVIPVFGLYMFEQLIGAVPILFYLQKIFKLTGKKNCL